MPSRRAVALIVAFWLLVTGYVVYRDLWPVLFASGPPSVTVDLADEAARRVPVRWRVMWNDKEVGRLSTRMEYVEADDTFRFTTRYTKLSVEMSGFTFFVPELTTTVRVTRDGDLREQTAEGELRVSRGEVPLGDVTMKLVGTVASNQLTAKFDGAYSLAGSSPQSLTKTLDPVPVPEGQPLNPLLPLNRLSGVSPDRPRWVVHETNPLNDALLAVANEFGIQPPQDRQQPLIGNVLSDPQDFIWKEQPVSCWVIEYRRSDVLEVRTWVRRDDGKVLKQEAFNKGETMTIVREE